MRAHEYIDKKNCEACDHSVQMIEAFLWLKWHPQCRWHFKCLPETIKGNQGVRKLSPESHPWHQLTGGWRRGVRRDQTSVPIDTHLFLHWVHPLQHHQLSAPRRRPFISRVSPLSKYNKQWFGDVCSGCCGVGGGSGAQISQVSFSVNHF